MLGFLFQESRPIDVQRDSGASIEIKEGVLENSFCLERDWNPVVSVIPREDLGGNCVRYPVPLSPLPLSPTLGWICLVGESLASLNLTHPPPAAAAALPRLRPPPPPPCGE